MNVPDDVHGVDDVEEFIESELNKPSPGTGRSVDAAALIRGWLESGGHFHKMEANVDSPPPWAELLISILAPKNTAQAQLGDLQEMFAKNVERLGVKLARRKYLMQVAASAMPLVWQWMKRIGFFTILVDYFRSKLGL